MTGSAPDAEAKLSAALSGLSAEDAKLARALAADGQAHLFAAWAVYLLVGYEQTLLPSDTPGLTWIVEQLLDALDSGCFATVLTDD